MRDLFYNWSVGFTYWSLDLFGHLVSLCWMFLGDVGLGLNLLKHYARCQKIKHHFAMMNGVQTTNMISCL